MKKLLVILLILASSLIKAQQGKIATLSLTPVVNLDGANGSCAAPGLGRPSVFNVPVSGVGVMTSTNRLLAVSIALTDCGTGTKNYNALQIRVVSPSGNCYGVYSGGLTPLGSGTHFLNLVSSTSCLNNPNTVNDANGGAPFLSTGNNGYFNAQFEGTPTNYSNYTGNADGTWRVIFSESTTNPPCVSLIRFFFGNPSTVSQGSAGDNCSNAIVWDGASSICGSTNGAAGSVQMPGSLTGPNTFSFGTIGGVSCAWNNANNNDVWIRYTATTANTCLSLSGLAGGGNNIQSIVVTDANVDSDNNPCTGPLPSGGNDSRWQLVSCPRNSIYTTTAGSGLHQQHCFTSEIGKTYYLVIDGDAGAISKFWMWGITYNGVLNLNREGTITRTITQSDRVVVFLAGESIITNTNNRRYNQRIYIYDASGREIATIKRQVAGYSKYSLNELPSRGTYFIKVLVDDELYSSFTFKVIK